jgi:hypothetical protein
MAEQTTEGNGTTTPAAKADSSLTKLDKEWKQRTGGKLPDAKEVKRLKAALQKAFDDEQAALKAGEAAREAFDKASQEALHAFGKRNVSLEGGVVLSPFSGKDDGKVIYRKMGTAEAIWRNSQRFTYGSSLLRTRAT